MRKVLLATTALIGVALAGSAHAAATSPISLNVGGYDDFVAGVYHEAQGTTVNKRANHDFENEYKLNFDALGKASNGVEYGGNISLWNGAEVDSLWERGGNTSQSFNSPTVNSAYVWLSGAFGKVLFGDEHGASDLFVYAPTVGEGQIDGRYHDFVDTTTLAYFQPSGIDNTEHSTKITYYTPKVGNESNKVQLGVSYIPNLYNYGQGVVKYQSPGAGVVVNPPTTATATYLAGANATSAYQDVVKGALQYTGNFHPVNVTASADIISGNHTARGLNSTLLGYNAPAGRARDFTGWGVGAQAGFNGATLGASYADQGSYNTVVGQNKSQDVFTVGGKYEFDKVGVALNYLNGEGYANYLANGSAATNSNTNYVSNFNALGAGAVYTWFPGLTSNLDYVLFSQKVKNQADHNDGYTLLFSQRLAF